ncbi:MAG: COX15/CtaA family protein [Acidobacteria bacterium]|nr:COX15/CtaA family protein [Acidobacteriota bacterium]MBS1866314.1 COX15/CtaA family protein [Acidobacteriota bacterium]
MSTTVGAADDPIGNTALPVASKNELNSLARFAWFVLLYNIAVILWGAYVRATGSGAGCGSHWPLCNGQIIPTSAQTQTLIEFTHRITSGLSLVLAAVLLIWCWRRTAKGDWPRYSAIAAAALLFNEALLGAGLVLFEYVGMDRSASRAIFLCLHFGNTLLLVAALTLTAAWLSGGARRLAVPAPRYERIVIVLGLLAVALTGMTGTLAALGDTIFPAASLKTSIAQDFSAGSHLLLRLRLLHPVLAAIAFLYILWMVYKLSKSREVSSRTLPYLTTILLIQIALGVLNVLLLAPIWLQITHLFIAEIFWIFLILATSDVLFRSPGPVANQ